MLACDCERLPPATARTLAQHHEVVAAAMDADALLPFRFGTAVPAGELAAWLAAHAARIRATLAELRGAVEMSVKLLRLHRGHGAEGSCPECAGHPFLVPRDEVGALLARIAPVASRAAGIAVVPTGPWPAYSFAGSFERLPLARVTATPPLADRLTG